MTDEIEIFLQYTLTSEKTALRLTAKPTETGFDILPINAGEAKGHGITFSATVLKASLPLWDNLPCFLDHDYTGQQSVKNLAGALHAPSWNEAEQGIQAQLVPGGPGAANLQALRLAARSDPALNVPITIPSNSVGLKGAYLKSVEIDYEVMVADLTSITFSIQKVTRGTDTNVAVVSAPTVTQDIAAASAKIVEQHKVVVTLSTPAWIANTEYYLLKIAPVAPATTTIDLLGAVANFTERI